MIRTEEQHLAHYGILRRSGRYPWNSGKNENLDESARNRTFLDLIDIHRKQGMSEAQIAEGYGITTTQLRAAKTIALAEQKQTKILTAQRLKEKGYSNVAIGERMGINESSVRALLAPGEMDKASALQTTSNMIKSHVDDKKMIDVGTGVESQLGITRNRLDTSVAMLREQGYELHTIKNVQLGTGKYTTMKVLAPPGTTLQEVQRNRSQIRQIDEHSTDHGRTFDGGFQPPISVKSSRIKINYADEGGAENDGVIFVRPNAKNLSLGSKRYGQVRVAVDGTHYLKGMAVYKDDLPDGVDIVFNTNKQSTGRKKDAMKEVSADPDFPFGSIVHQIHGSNGKVNSAMNLVNEEGDWDKWSKTLSSQMLSKQSPELAKQQLSLTHERRLKEFAEINSLTNATVRKELLIKFADSTDSAAVHLKAAALPRQATKVLLPINSIHPKEVYAPSFRDGERVVLIRYPHGGTFEIPELTVNNKNREARKILGPQAMDAIGIHHTVAHRLSGADFDGDTVLVIPNNKKSVKYTPALEGLKGFDPQVYKIPAGSPIPRMTSTQKGQQMGKISNLITDMTLHKANTDELARAIRHSMVVIDAEKHGLDFKKSEKDNGIASLKEKYQGKKTGGASTLISQARAEVRVNQRNPRSSAKGGPIDLVTGKKVYEDTGYMVSKRKLVRDPVTGKKKYVDTGVMEPKRFKSERLAETHDATSLSSGTKMEEIYAAHSNQLKALANTARKESVHTKNTPYSPSAKAAYSQEVGSINAKLNVAKKNAPRERQAQLLANAQVSQRRQANPNMDPADVKKIKQQQLNEARIRTGAKKDKIILTQAEWNAIQAGAISTNVLESVISNSDVDTIKRLAMPKTTPKLTPTMMRRAQSMMDSGYSQSDVADALGIGLTTLKVGLNE